MSKACETGVLFLSRNFPEIDLWKEGFARRLSGPDVKIKGNIAPNKKLNFLELIIKMSTPERKFLNPKLNRAAILGIGVFGLLTALGGVIYGTAPPSCENKYWCWVDPEGNISYDGRPTGCPGIPDEFYRCAYEPPINPESCPVPIKCNTGHHDRFQAVGLGFICLGGILTLICITVLALSMFGPHCLLITREYEQHM